MAQKVQTLFIDDLDGSAAESTVRFHASPGLALDGLAAALPAGASVAEGPPGTYVVQAEIGPQLLATVTAWCAEQHVMPEGLAVERRTLEDVFLALTGRELRD